MIAYQVPDCVLRIGVKNGQAYLIVSSNEFLVESGTQ